ncbi:hypothetical protein E2562_033136 [Oryza meyeriana var. granulata]|uniref:Uncharacterized protein n=1 Tax=Oryza meyeriana var. granulata TaxID=110450 RepID=A0A6G1CKG5_9ORYZ|nr:hypothetical protein E2562_033136 [Oryza meyeriana var. granulata]
MDLSSNPRGHEAHLSGNRTWAAYSPQRDEEYLLCFCSWASLLVSHEEEVAGAGPGRRHSITETQSMRFDRGTEKPYILKN